jgi:hypothetical protein
MKKGFVLIVSVILFIMPTLLMAACLNESRDPFTSTMSLNGEKRTVSISGNSTGHTADKQSEFELFLNNRSGENSWEGEFSVLLIDQNGILAEIAREQFAIPIGQEMQYWITAEFPENFKGPIGLGVVIPGCTSMVTTLWVGKVEGVVGPWSNPFSLTEQGGRELAEKFVRNSPTFVFDGIEESLTLKETTILLKEHKPGSPDTLSKVHGWSFTFNFESRHAGYGDRSGQVLNQAITPHEAIIMVEAGEVTKAILDGVWNMINQHMLSIKTGK